MRKVARTLRLSVWPRVKSAIDEAIGIRHCTVNKTDMTITLPNGSMFLFIGADDPDKLKSLENATLFWLEEATEFDEADHDTVDAGMSTPGNRVNQIWLTYNPVPQIPGHQHWLQRRYLRKELPIGKPVVDNESDVTVLRTTYKQNAFCPEPTKKLLESYKDKNPSLYKMWALGEFSTLEGAILSNWGIVKLVPDGVSFIAYGLDFGYANDPATVVAIWQHNDDLYLREDIYSTGLTNQSLGRQMSSVGITRNHIVRGDSAEPKSIRELKDMGFSVVPSEKGSDYKRAAAQWLQSKNIYIVEGSTNLIREISTWSWDRDKQGNLLPRPADGDDHTIDAVIYGAYRKQKSWRPL